MASPAEDRSAATSELRRSVGQATNRIHEIIDAAERVATEIRTDAEAEAQAYLDERRREADRFAAERTRALDQLSATLTDTAERFKREAETLLADLDGVIAQARAGVDRDLAPAAPAPSADREPERRPLAPAPEPEPAAEEPAPVAVASYADTAAERAEAGEPEADQTSEALLRATQMAVTGKDRAEIIAALRNDFPLVDAEAVVHEILG